MPAIDDSLINSLRQFGEVIKNKYSLDHLYLFGSYAENKQDEWSDIDIAVVLDDTEGHGRELFCLGKDFDTNFEVFSLSKRDFDLSLLPIVAEIKTKGVKIL